MTEPDPAAPGGIPGTAPMADPTELRHQRHYVFAYRAIPSLVFADDPQMFAALAFSRGEMAREMWTKTGGSAEDAEQIMVTLVRLLTHDVVVITMPEVRQSPEAIFVGVAHPNGRPGFRDESTGPRVFFLEAGLSQPMLGEVTADGTHRTHTETCKPELEHFTALLDEVLTA